MQRASYDGRGNTVQPSFRRAYNRNCFCTDSILSICVILKVKVARDHNNKLGSRSNNPLNHPLKTNKSDGAQCSVTWSNKLTKTFQNELY